MFDEEHYLHYLLSKADLRLLAAQFCTHLLAVGVIKKLDENEGKEDTYFRVSLQKGIIWILVALQVQTPNLRLAGLQHFI